MSPIKVAVVGCWHVHASDYAHAVADHPETELVAVWDDHEERGRALASSYGMAFVDDIEAVWGSDDIDGVIITTATDQHLPAMLAAARTGKHIFTEKLLAPTVAEAEQAVAAADTGDVCLVVSLPRLYTGYTAVIKDAIDEERLGRITYGRVRLSHDGAVRRDGDSGWLPERFFDLQAAVGGALTDLGCHPGYLVQLFLGANPDTVSATYRSVSGHPVDDNAVVTVGYPDQKIGVIEAGFVSGSPFTIEIFGTEGALLYSDDDDRLLASGKAFGGEGFGRLEVPADGPGPFARWVEHIKDGTRADDNLARAVELTRLVVAANRAAAEARTIPYPAG